MTCGRPICRTEHRRRHAELHPQQTRFFGIGNLTEAGYQFMETAMPQNLAMFRQAITHRTLKLLLAMTRAPARMDGMRTNRSPAFATVGSQRSTPSHP
jgi:hypothetical protein